MLKWAKDLFPFCRSITGKGLRDTIFYLKKIISYTSVLLLIQVLLGVLTVIKGAPILLASLHQLGSILLVTSSLVLVYENY